MCANIYTWFTLLLVSFAYLFGVAPYVIDHGNVYIPVINCLLFASSVGMLLLTGFTDPGIIPRKEILELSDNPIYEKFKPPSREKMIEAY